MALTVSCKSQQAQVLAGETGGVSEAEQTMAQAAQLETATFGAGCFWGVQYRFAQVDGVVDTAAGYMGGTVDHPTYHQVCTDRTGHTEVVQVRYDPARVSYQELLDLFFAWHDPTQVNRQGPDVGRQYRSVVFYHTPEQEAAARATKERLAGAGKYTRPIATAIEPASTFWRAEEYHQNYYIKKGITPPTCR